MAKPGSDSSRPDQSSPSWPNWAVRLAVSYEDSVALSRHLQIVKGNGVGTVTLAPSDWQDDVAGFSGPATLTIHLRAHDPQDAEDRAQWLFLKTRRVAGLSDAFAPVVWVAPLRGDSQSRGDFLQMATDLFAEEKFEMAIIAAQIHFETQLRLLLEGSAQRIPGGWAPRLTKQRLSGNIRSPITQAIIELLLGLEVTATPEWARFDAHVDRRNDIVHKAQRVSRGQAVDSLEIVEALWIRLADAARNREGLTP